MISRYINDNNETYGYPLAENNTVYPQGLLSDISLTVVDNVGDVFIDAITVSSNGVHILVVIGDTEDAVPLCSGHCSKQEYPIMALKKEGTGECIGWAYLGSLCDGPEMSYIQRVPLCRSCVKRVSGNTGVIKVNGYSYTIPTHLNISAKGDISAKEDIPAREDISVKNTGTKFCLYNSYDPDSTLYDEDSMDAVGPLTSVNGTPSNAGVISIILPKGLVPPDTPSESVDSTLFEAYPVDDSVSASSRIISIMSKYDIYGSDSALSDDQKSLYSPFTCPNSDILLDKIDIKDVNLKHMEAPLDTFINWYRGEEESSSSIV